MQQKYMSNSDIQKDAGKVCIETQMNKNAKKEQRFERMRAQKKRRKRADAGH